MNLCKKNRSQTRHTHAHTNSIKCITNKMWNFSLFYKSSSPLPGLVSARIAIPPHCTVHISHCLWAMRWFHYTLCIVSFSRNSQLKLVEFAFIPSNIVSIIHFVCEKVRVRMCAFIFNLHNVRGAGWTGSDWIEGWNESLVVKSQNEEEKSAENLIRIISLGSVRKILLNAHTRTHVCIIKTSGHELSWWYNNRPHPLFNQI